MKVSPNFILDHIRAIRREKGFKSAYMAQKLGISQGEYSKLENGMKRNFNTYLPEIANILAINIEDLRSMNMYKRQTSTTYQHEPVTDYKRLYELLISEYQDKDRLKAQIIVQLKEENSILRMEIHKLRSGIENTI